MVGRVVEPIGDVPALAAAIRAFAEMPAVELATKKQAAAAAARPLYAASNFSEQLTSARNL
jgi:hypothetical protein